MPVLSAPLAALAAFGYIAAGYPVYLFTQVHPQRRTIVGTADYEAMTWNESMATKMHRAVDAVLSLFQRHKERSTAQGTAYEAVEVEDQDADVDHRQDSTGDMPMREISRQ